MEQRMRALDRKLDLGTYAHDKLAAFTFKPGAGTESHQPEPIHVPVPIMYRFYHLGRAYDLNQLKLLHPTGTAVVSFAPLQLLIQELEQVAQLVNDPVVRHYAGLLAQAFTEIREDTHGLLQIRAL